MKCENCGQEFDGTVCPNCGTVADKTEGSISDSKILSENPLKHTEPASEKVKSGISKNKIFVAVITVLIALTALVILFSIIFSNINTNLFHLNKIELVQIGMRKDEVKDIYGNPDAVAENDSLWMYYSENYKKLLEKAADGTDISNEAAAFIHNEIRITFFDEKVYAVEMLINFSEKTKDTSREIKSVTYNQNGNASYSYLENEIYAIVEYRDGSYRNAPVIISEQWNAGASGKLTFTWNDPWSNRFLTGELLVYSASEIELKGCLRESSGVYYTAYKVDNGYALEIYGQGIIEDSHGYPWNEIKRSLISVNISEGITGIGDSAFSGCESLTSIVIPDSVTSIGDSVFSGCESLTNIEIPDGVTNVGRGAFDQTPWFDNQPDGAVYAGKTLYRYKGIMPADTNFSVREGTESIAAGAFYGCGNLKSIVIPSSVTSIGAYAFEACKNLQSVGIPSSVTSIGDSAFYGCESLTSIEIPDGVTSIGSYAFSRCNSLTSIVIPSSVIRIESDAFYDCMILVIYAEPENKPGNWNNSWNGDIPIVWYCKNNDVADDGYIYTVQNGLRYGIKEGTATVLKQPRNIVEANIESEIAYGDKTYNVTSIVPYAFYRCVDLEKVIVGNNVTSIKSSAFHGCENLTEVVIGNSVNNIDSDAFFGCVNLEVLTVAEGNAKYHSAGNCLIETARKTLIAGCKGSVIPTDGSVTSIGSQAFWGSRGITSIAIPDSVTSVGSSAFYGCSSLLSIAIGNGVTSIGFSAFKETGIWNNAADNSVVYADKWAVGYKGTLSSVTLKADTVGIGDSAFDECRSLKSIAIPNGVTCIGRYAFYNCSSLLSIEIPDSVTSIDSSAFASCGNLTELKMAADLAGVYGANNVKKVILTGGTSIGGNAFRGCGSLERIEIPNSVTSIGYQAFNGCSGLLSIEIPDSVTSIGGNAFDGCVNLKISVNEGNQFFSSQDGILYNKAKTEIKFVPYSVEGTLTIQNGITRIYDKLLKGRVGLTGVVIPDSVTSIGSQAFFGCNSLQSIVIPNSITSIGSQAFQDTGIWNNAAENSVVYADKWAVGYKGTLNGNLTFEADMVGIGDSAFRDCPVIRSVEVTDSVKNIGKNAFENCALTSMTMSASIAGAYGADKNSLQTLTVTGTGSIPERAFADDAYDSLTNIVIENGVTGIGYNAFCCGNLTSIIIPQSVTVMGMNVFFGCPALTIYAEAAAKPEGWRSDWDGSCQVVWDYKNNETAADGYVYYIDNGIRYGLKDGEAKVAGQATDLTTANIRETVIYKGTAYRVTSIGSNAFSVDLFRSRILKSVFIPDSVTSIGHSAFYGCSGLTSIEIPISVTSISTSAFAYCSGLETISVASGNPKYYSVSNCIIDRETKTLVLGCKNSRIQSDGSVTSIGEHAFDGCSGLQSITIPDSVTTIGYCAFYECSSLQSIEIPVSVTSIGSYAFCGCRSLQGIVIPNGITSIGDYAFQNCSNLQSIVIPNNITSIGNGVFWGCGSLESIEIPNSVTSIGDNAFQGCHSLTSIVIPSGVTNIGSQAFYECLSLQSIAIPNGVTNIGDSAFSYCIRLTSIAIPRGVTSIGCSAFNGCSRLASISIPDSVTSIGSFAFYGTGIWNNAEENSVVYADKWVVDYKGDETLVDALTLKADTIGIADYAFYRCSSLTSIEIPNGLTSIGSYAFYECSNLTSITIPDSVTSISFQAFSGCSSLQSITIPQSVTSIGSFAFYWCYSLTSIAIPNSVTSIGYSAFEGCSSLTSIAIPDSVTSIGFHAFFDCSSLQSIAIPDSVTIIGDGAFSGCSSLTSIEFRGTKAEWKAITKGSNWNDNTGEYTVTCTDGTLSKTESAA